MKVGKSMLVSEYFEGTVSNKPYKYQTKLNMVRCLKRLGLWHLEYAEITPNLCWERIDSHFNMNVKRVYAGAESPAVRNVRRIIVVRVLFICTAYLALLDLSASSKSLYFYK